MEISELNIMYLAHRPARESTALTAQRLSGDLPYYSLAIAQSWTFPSAPTSCSLLGQIK